MYQIKKGAFPWKPWSRLPLTGQVLFQGGDRALWRLQRNSALQGSGHGLCSASIAALIYFLRKSKSYKGTTVEKMKGDYSPRYSHSIYTARLCKAFIAIKQKSNSLPPTELIIIVFTLPTFNFCLHMIHLSLKDLILPTGVVCTVSGSIWTKIL